MTHPASGPTGPPLEVRGTRASSVIVQRIPPRSADAFMEWQRGITAAAAGRPGYQATEVYPPADGRQREWVVIIHFDDAKTLRDWLESPTRAEWTANLPAEIRDFRLKTFPTGFGPWFAGVVEGGGPLPHWKMFLTVLFALYPTVMLLTLFLSPYTEGFGLAVAMLIGNAASVSFLEWLGMPVLNRLFGPWLRANGKEARTLSLLGLLLLVGALGLMAFVFSLAIGRP
jgi:antibiotic biosynthesis monooxygenase (ABM) superfamily enzyme